MTLIQLPQSLNQLAALIAAGLFFSVTLAAQEKERPKGNSGWEELTKEEQQKLREALRTVWSDPNVLSARENVNRSAKEYHTAVRESIGKKDPATRKLLERVQKSQSGFVQAAMGGSGGFKKHIHGASVNRLSQLIAPPGIMEKMSQEQKEKFKEVGAQAKQQPGVVQAIEELKSLSKADEEIRQKKLEAFRKFRRAYFDAIIEIEPTLEQFLPPPGSSPPHLHGKGKGKGSRKGKPAPPLSTN